jgi:hypothetical protein
VASDCKIINGHLHSPYFIFIRATGWLSDRDILTFLGLSDFVASPPGRALRTRYMYFTENDEWIHIADDWSYHLWYRGQEAVAALHERAAGSPTFACAVGEDDRSFDFSYYFSGELVRRYVVEDPHYDRRRRIVTEDFGKPLSGEKSLSDIGDEQEYVLSLAAGLGVKLEHQPSAIRCYAKPEPLPRS